MLNKWFLIGGIIDFFFGLLLAMIGFTMAMNPESAMFPLSPYNQAIGVAFLIVGIIVMISSIGVIMQKKIAAIAITAIFAILLVLYLIQSALTGKIGIEGIVIYALIIWENYVLIKKC